MKNLKKKKEEFLAETVSRGMTSVETAGIAPVSGHPRQTVGRRPTTTESVGLGSY